MISYTPNPDQSITVHLDKKVVGTIRRVAGGWQYFPQGRKEGGSIWPSIARVKREIEGED
jgi:hypothetical protein